MASRLALDLTVVGEPVRVHVAVNGREIGELVEASGDQRVEPAMAMPPVSGETVIELHRDLPMTSFTRGARCRDRGTVIATSTRQTRGRRRYRRTSDKVAATRS